MRMRIYGTRRRRLEIVVVGVVHLKVFTRRLCEAIYTLLCMSLKTNLALKIGY